MSRDRSLLVRSVLDPAAAAAQSNVGRIGDRWHPRHEVDGMRPVIVGEITQDSVRLVVRRADSRNAMAPMLRARFVEVPGGSEVVGSFGLRPFTRGLLTVWFGLLASVIVFALVRISRFTSVAEAVLTFGALLATAAFGVGLVALGTRMGRRDEQLLREWLHLQLRPRS